MKRIAYLMVLSILIGCGGGGGGGGVPSQPPIVIISSASFVVADGAELNGSVSPNELDTQAWFEYGTDPNLITYTSTIEQGIGFGASAVQVSQTISGCTSGSTYYYRVCGRNANGTTKSTITSFVTSSPIAAPTVTTLAASSVASGGAVLNGNVAPNGKETNTWFEWGTSSTLSTFTSTLSQTVNSSVTNQSVSDSIIFPSSGTYYYRIVASNSIGTTYGNINSFSITTEISGIINTNTTLSASNSPYHFNNVQLAYGSVLNIEPGVVINSGEINIFGTLNAIGDSTNRIKFNNVSIKQGNNVSWEPFIVNIQHAEITGGAYYGGGSGYGSLSLKDSIIKDLYPRIFTYIWYPVSDCYIERNIFINSPGLHIGTGMAPVYIVNNVFYNQFGEFAIRNWADYGADTVVLHNSFLSTDRIALALAPGYSTAKIDGINNYWNTTDTTIIDSMIYDKYDDLSSAGYINYLPILTNPHPDTPDPSPYIP